MRESAPCSSPAPSPTSMPCTAGPRGAAPPSCVAASPRVSSRPPGRRSHRPGFRQISAAINIVPRSGRASQRVRSAHCSSVGTGRPGLSPCQARTRIRRLTAQRLPCRSREELEPGARSRAPLPALNRPRGRSRLLGRAPLEGRGFERGGSQARTAAATPPSLPALPATQAAAGRSGQPPREAEGLPAHAEPLLRACRNYDSATKQLPQPERSKRTKSTMPCDEERPHHEPLLNKRYGNALPQRH